MTSTYPPDAAPWLRARKATERRRQLVLGAILAGWAGAIFLILMFTR